MCSGAVTLEALERELRPVPTLLAGTGVVRWRNLPQAGLR